MFPISTYFPGLRRSPRNDAILYAGAFNALGDPIDVSQHKPKPFFVSPPPSPISTGSTLSSNDTYSTSGKLSTSGSFVSSDSGTMNGTDVSYEPPQMSPYRPKKELLVEITKEQRTHNWADNVNKQLGNTVVQPHRLIRAASRGVKNGMVNNSGDWIVLCAICLVDPRINTCAHFNFVRFAKSDVEKVCIGRYKKRQAPKRTAMTSGEEPPAKKKYEETKGQCE